MMRRALVALLVALTADAAAGPADLVYDDTELARWQRRYPDGVRANYQEVLLPALDAQSRAKLDAVPLRFPLRVPGAEPLAFYADRDGIVLSIASIKMLDDLAVAQAWLQLNGYSQETLYEYVHWLQRSAPRIGNRPPGPLDALCIPDDALSDAGVDSLAQKILKSQVFFILAHELGHILYQHPGYDGVARGETRGNEAQADAFALDVFSRIGEPPLGLAGFFMLAAYADRGRGDFDSDADWRAWLARRTHPVDSERLRAVAAHLGSQRSNYAGTFPAATLEAVAGQMNIIADTLADPEMQAFLAGRGNKVTLASLAPRRPGQTLGSRCGPIGAAAFSGRLAGQVLIGGQTFDLSMVLDRVGDRVRGQYDFGAGVGIIDGLVDGDRLDYRWASGADSGRGRLDRQGGTYTGTWGYGHSQTNGGTWQVSVADDD